MASRLARWLSAFIAAWFSLKLLHSKKSKAFLKDTPVDSVGGVESKPGTHYGGRTIDLTLFAVTRGLDVLVAQLWSQHRTRREAVHKWTLVGC